MSATKEAPRQTDTLAGQGPEHYKPAPSIGLYHRNGAQSSERANFMNHEDKPYGI